MKFITLNAPLPYQACVATIGFFDGVHRGHRFLIQNLVRYATEHGLASLLITFRIHPRQVMQSDYQPSLLTTYGEKCAYLAATSADCCLTLDFTREMAALSARQFMQDVLKDKLAVSALVTGYDHRFGHNRSESFADYVQYGREMQMDVLRSDAFSLSGVNVSSSMIRSCLIEGEVGMAARCLTRPYSLTGLVVHGFHEGHSLGYPTANIEVDDCQKLIPKNGSYAVWVTTEADMNGGRPYMGMLNIGCRPTLEDSGKSTIEVYLLDFSGDLYGSRLTVSFVKRLRDERKFRSKAELTRQLGQDEKEVRAVLSGDGSGTMGENV